MSERRAVATSVAKPGRRVARAMCGAAFAFGALAMAARGAYADFDPATAKALFNEGRALIEGVDQLGDPAAKAAKLDAACAKFAASLELDPQLGTQLNLGDCRARQGKLVDAYAIFEAALATATRTHDRAAFVQKQLSALAAKLVKVTLRVGEPERAGLVVELSGRGIPREGWQRTQVAEPGAIVVRASAPGRTPVTIKRDAAAGSQLTIDVPGLEPARGGAAVATTGTTTGRTSGPTSGSQNSATAGSTSGNPVGTTTGRTSGPASGSQNSATSGATTGSTSGNTVGTTTSAIGTTGTGATASIPSPADAAAAHAGDDSSAAAASAGPSDAPADASPSLVPWIVVGAGALVLGASLGTAIDARVRYDDAQQPKNPTAINNAVHQADVATGIGVAGGVIAAVGVGLVIYSHHRHAATVTVSASRDAVGLAAVSRF